MSSISQGFVLATAMVVSSTALFLAFCRQRSFPATQLSENQNSQQPEKKILRSCLCSGIQSSSCVFFSFLFLFNMMFFAPNLLSFLWVFRVAEEKKREIKKKKKKVKFAENVKEPSGNGEEYRKGHMKSREIERSCRNEIREVRRMPENRVALYGGILKNRVQRMQCSY
jgi:hypothetical protein